LEPPADKTKPEVHGINARTKNPSLFIAISIQLSEADTELRTAVQGFVSKRVIAWICVCRLWPRGMHTSHLQYLICQFCCNDEKVRRIKV
jgi:hypothetical protein